MDNSKYNGKGLTDEEVRVLVSEAQNGSKEAITKLFESFESFRKSTAKRYMNRGVDNADVCQEVDTLFCVAIMNYDPKKDSSPKRHLVSYTRNRSANFYRGQLNETRPLVLYGDRYWELESIISGYKVIEDNMVCHEEGVIDFLDMQEHIDALPPKLREVVVLYYYEDMSQEEISDILGIAQSNVSRRLLHAESILGEVLAWDTERETKLL